jgi:hypothetical protein
MLQRVVAGQVRFNMPGLTADARGVVQGKQLCARFSAIDRLVAFLRVVSAEQSLDDLQPGFRIVYARGGAGTREAIVLMPAVSPSLAELVAHGARLAGGQTFTGAGKHFVQFRDARAPLGYDVDALADAAADLLLYGAEQTVPYRIESELPLAKLLLRLSLVHMSTEPASLPGMGGLGGGIESRARTGVLDGPLFLTVRRGLGPTVAAYLHRATEAMSGGRGARTVTPARAPASTVEGAPEPPRRMRAAAALCEGSGGSAFASTGAFWLFRVENVPARMRALLTGTPGLELYVPVTDNVAVAAGFRHPIHLESCRGSFPQDRLHLMSPRGVTEIAPLPTLAALEDVVRIRVPAAEPIDPRRLASSVPQDLAMTLRLEPSGQPPGRPIAALVPWTQARWLKRLLYALPPSALRSYRVAFLERGVLVLAGETLDGIPFGTLFESAAPDVLVPVGTRVRPAVSPALLAERLRATGGALVLFVEAAEQPLRIPAAAITPLEPRLLADAEPLAAGLTAGDAAAEEPGPERPVEIENQPLGPMPLWGLGDG